MQRNGESAPERINFPNCRLESSEHFYTFIKRHFDAGQSKQFQSQL